MPYLSVCGQTIPSLKRVLSGKKLSNLFNNPYHAFLTKLNKWTVEYFFSYRNIPLTQFKKNPHMTFEGM
jgi:hypothetical protein